jgi:hypothetical protein
VPNNNCQALTGDFRASSIAFDLRLRLDWLGPRGFFIMRVLGIVALCAALGGCAGSDTHLRMLENSNALQVEPSQSKDFDYVVRMKNLVDIGYNPDNPETVGNRRRQVRARGGPLDAQAGEADERSCRPDDG